MMSSGSPSLLRERGLSLAFVSYLQGLLHHDAMYRFIVVYDAGGTPTKPRVRFLREARWQRQE
jgi:hypothetical protein